MGGTRPNPGTALWVVTFRQRQSFPRSDPGQVPAEGGQAAVLNGEGWDRMDGWLGEWVGGGGEGGGGLGPSGFPIAFAASRLPRLLSPAAAGRQGTRELPSQALGLRQAEDRATSRGRARARAPAVIGRHGGSFLSAPLCFALWF